MSDLGPAVAFAALAVRLHLSPTTGHKSKIVTGGVGWLLRCTELYDQGGFCGRRDPEFSVFVTALDTIPLNLGADSQINAIGTSGLVDTPIQATCSNQMPGGSVMTDATDPSAELTLSDKVRNEIVLTKVTCPFLGSAVHQSFLPVRGSAENPLASIDDVRRLGNRGGGDLGDLLVVFAAGNHAFMRGDSGKLDKKVPDTLFSLELPGSQGSHPGHSGILEGDPEKLGSGRVSEPDFDRLARQAINGFVKRSDVGRFIAQNLIRDPRSRVFDTNVVALLAGDFLTFMETAVPTLLKNLFGSNDEATTARRESEEKLTKLLGADNLVGSAGEFGLLFAFLANKPGAKEIDGEPAASIEDVRALFLNKCLPAGWETWKKTRASWVEHTTALLLSAGTEYQSLKK